MSVWRERLLRRPVLSSTGAAGLVALGFTFLGNQTFWVELVRATGGVATRPFLLATLALLLFVTHGLIFSLVNFKGLFKPVASGLLLLSVVVDHFMGTDGIRLDAAMVRNIAETDTREALELITPRLLLHLLLFGIVPVVLLARTEIRYRRPRRELALRLGLSLAGLALIGGLGLGSYKSVSGFARVHPGLRRLITPYNFIAAARSYARERWQETATVVTRLGTDARPAPSASRRERRKLVVLVVGETARAASFSLNGYERQTNPRLAELDVVSFSRFRACGTSTAASLPCMFAVDSGSEDGRGAGRWQEGLLDVLAHAGVDVLWRDNNSGCKHVCDRVRTESLTHAEVSGLCDGGQCLDAVLLGDLELRLAHVEKDTLIVLHQKGSHGPIYRERYPPAFARFAPACADNDLHGCTQEAIVNAYDNTILYTDHVLAELIDLLRRNAERLDTGLIYVSDHGESLGENGIYLHGLPLALAPDEQTHVPFIAWFSEGFAADSGLDARCLRARRELPASHRNLSPTVLGLLDVETSVYDPALDLFEGCRQAPWGSTTASLTGSTAGGPATWRAARARP